MSTIKSVSRIIAIATHLHIRPVCLRNNELYQVPFTF